MIKTSKKIQQFFDEHTRLEGFCDFIREEQPYDVNHWCDEMPFADDAFLEGYELARKYKNKPIYRYTTDDTTLYFGGSEAAIIKKLKAGWKKWPKTKEAKQKREKQKLKETLQNQLKTVQQQLKELKELE